MTSLIQKLFEPPVWNPNKTPNKIAGKILCSAALILSANSKHPAKSLQEKIITLFKKHGDKQLSHVKEVSDLFKNLKEVKIGGQIDSLIKAAFQGLTH